MRAKIPAKDALEGARRVDIRRLVRLYGAETAGEVLRKLVSAYARDQDRGASRRTR
jgi:hypothetical protein